MGAATWSLILQFNHNTVSMSSTLVLPGALRLIRNLPLTRSRAHREHPSRLPTRAVKEQDEHHDLSLVSKGYLENFSYKLAQSLTCRKTLCCSAKAPGNGESSQHPKICSSAW